MTQKTGAEIEGKMAIYFDIITGFLESGKTTLIKEMIEKNCFMEYKKTVLILCEEGFTEYEEDLLSKHGIDMITVNEQSELNELFFQNLKNEYSPDHIIMEFNGTWDISPILNLKLPFTYQIRNVIFTSEAGKFNNYLGNMVFILQPHILNSDIVLFNRHEEASKKQKKTLRQDIKKINNRSGVIFYSEASVGDMIARYFPPHEKYYRISEGTKIGILFLVVFTFMSNRMLFKAYEFIQSISTIFLSILIEALPFVLLGAIISSVIQLFVPSEWIRKRFSDKKFSSFFIASIAGFFMPICDCGTVPIVSGLLKKETPLPQTITFWLASSAVNPIVLISVYYAFPGQPYLVLIRVITGVLVAILTGLIIKISHLETKHVIKKFSISQNIGSDILELKYNRTLGKLEAVIKGARLEFFRVIKYLILGAFVSSFLQTVIPQTMKGFLSSSLVLQLIFMVIAAIFMSTCSTSNAFIGRSFLRSFRLMPIMSYIVLGPMLDFKNMLMLSEIMKKRYLILLAVTVSLIGSILFFILSLYL